MARKSIYQSIHITLACCGVMSNWNNRHFIGTLQLTCTKAGFLLQKHWVDFSFSPMLYVFFLFTGQSPTILLVIFFITKWVKIKNWMRQNNTKKPLKENNAFDNVSCLLTIICTGCKLWFESYCCIIKQMFLLL